MNALEPEIEISLIRDDPWYRLQRRIGLIPESGLGIVRRAIFFALVAWLPITVWAAFTHRALPGTVEEPLLQHFGIHIRFLFAVPLLVLGEGVAHVLTTRLIPYFASSGLIRDDQREAFRDILRGVIRLRNSTLPWIVILAILASWLGLQHPGEKEHELIWANVGDTAHFDLGFGGWWLAYVARPIFGALVCAWLWRLVLLFVLLKRIAGLDLQIVPTHPDRAGGLSFLEKLPRAFSLFALAISAVVSSRLAHEVVYHGVHVMSLKLVAITLLVTVTALCLAPLLVFLPTLAKARHRALLEYGALVGDHGRRVRRIWISRQPVADRSLLEAPELGPVADTAAIYESVEKMRIAPIGKEALLAIAVPVVIPLLALFAIEIPIKDVLLKILGALA